MKIELTMNAYHNGKLQKAGSVIDLDDDEAEALIAARAARKPPQPQKSDSKK